MGHSHSAPVIYLMHEQTRLFCAVSPSLQQSHPFTVTFITEGRAVSFFEVCACYPLPNELGGLQRCRNICHCSRKTLSDMFRVMPKRWGTKMWRWLTFSSTGSLLLLFHSLFQFSLVTSVVNQIATDGGPWRHSSPEIGTPFACYGLSLGYNSNPSPSVLKLKNSGHWATVAANAIKKTVGSVIWTYVS